VIRINLMPREERAKRRKMPTVKLPRSVLACRW
jgi:hypothetical protein